MTTPGHVAITLNPTELFTASVYGILRRLSAIQRNRHPRYGDPGRNLWQIDIDAAVAEMTVAKHLGVYWEPLMPNGKVDASKPDIGRSIQVRSISRPDDRLLIHRNDDDDAAFYLVYCDAPTYTILGWIYGSDGKRDEWWQTFTGRPAFFVPQSALNPADSAGAAKDDSGWASAENYDSNGNVDAPRW